MDARLEAELALLRTRFPDLQFDPGRWILLPAYHLPQGWTPPVIPIAFSVQASYPATPPYAFCVPEEVRFKEAVPGNSTAPVSVPFPGSWRQISWTPESWLPGAEPQTGSNLVQWALGFIQRFQEGA
jgi:hypothetical protein